MHRRVGAVDTLWSAILKIDDQISTARLLSDLYTVEELNHVLQKGHPTLTGLFAKCHEQFSVDTPMGGLVTSKDMEVVRPFVSDRLWSLFFMIRAIYYRLGMLTAKSVDRKQYLEWRHDELIRKSLVKILPREIAVRVIENNASGFGSIICPNIEAIFLAEARLVLDGNLTGAPIEPVPETRVKVKGFGPK